MNRAWVIFMAAAGVLVLGACSELKAIGEATGVVATQEQDAIQARNARLSLPPDYSLRPPQPGSGATRSKAAAVRGRQTIIGDKRKTTARTQVIRQANRSPGEAALIRRASGNQKIDRGIRRTLDRETKRADAAEKSFTDKLLKWRSAPPKGAKGEAGTRPDDDKNVPRMTKKGEF